MNIELNRINEEIKYNAAEYINAVNTEYAAKVRSAAENIIAHRNERPVILLAGPSGSGKTTTAFMLEKLLDERGFETHTLSLDNYFRSLTEEERELAAAGKMDLESPERIDKELLNRQIEAIERCEPVDIPKYDFANSARKGTAMTLERSPGELVIFEGIHALNPELITVPDDQLCRIYVSVRTRIVCGDTVLHPSKVRLLRRMIRDSRFRKRPIAETLNMFHSVEQGENKYIMPYKYRSDFDIDTFIAYEIAAYKDTLLPEIKQIPELEDLREVLEGSASLDNTLITPDSLICEFIGSGEFEY
ncbi:MAG: nucleoside kinase [Ruminococcus sp.]|nr:nucleoside kinase [Ruminococcus sp.]